MELDAHPDMDYSKSMVQMEDVAPGNESKIACALQIDASGTKETGVKEGFLLSSQERKARTAGFSGKDRKRDR